MVKKCLLKWGLSPIFSPLKWASMIFFQEWGWGVWGVVGSTPNYNFRGLWGYEVCKIYSCKFFFGVGGGVVRSTPNYNYQGLWCLQNLRLHFQFFWGWVGGLGGWGGHGKHPKLILLWPMHVSMHYTHVLNHFDFTIYFAFWWHPGALCTIT